MTVGQYVINYRLRRSGGSETATATAIVNVVASVSATLTAAPTSVSGGGGISATATGGPANTTDWVALYTVGETNMSNYTDWWYLKNNLKTVPAAPGVAGGTVNFTMPSTPGNYVFRFWALDETDVLLATSNTVTVTAASSASVNAVNDNPAALTENTGLQPIHVLANDIFTNLPGGSVPTITITGQSAGFPATVTGSGLSARVSIDTTVGAGPTAPGAPIMAHAIHSGLAWFLGSHPPGAELQKELVSNTSMNLAGNAVMTGVHPVNSTWRCLSIPAVSAGGSIYSTLTSAVMAIGDTYSIWADVVFVAAGSFGTLWVAPITAGAWTGNFAAVHYSRSASTDAAFHRHTTSTPASPTITASAGSFPVTAGRRRVWLTRSGTSITFGVNGAVVSSHTITGGAPNWAGNTANQIIVGNRAVGTQTGEDLAGLFLRVMVWNRALTTGAGGEMEQLNTDPLLGLGT